MVKKVSAVDKKLASGVEMCAGALTRFVAKHNGALENVLLYFDGGGGSPWRLVGLCVNSDVTDIKDLVTRLKPDAELDFSYGEEVELRGLNVPARSMGEALAFAHRLAAALEASPQFKTASDGWFCAPLFHDEESHFKLRLYNEARGLAAPETTSPREITVAQIEKVFAELSKEREESPLVMAVELVAHPKQDEGLTLGLLVEAVPGTPSSLAAQIEEQRELGRDSLGIDANEWDQSGYGRFEDVGFDIRVLRNKSTLAAVRDFASRHGFPGVVEAKPSDVHGTGRYFWLSKVSAPVRKPTSPLRELEYYWVELCVFAIRNAAERDRLQLANVVLIFDSWDSQVCDCRGLNEILVNVSVPTLAKLVKKPSYSPAGGVNLLGKMNFSVAGTEVDTERAMIRLAHRIAARIETHPALAEIRAPGSFFAPLFFVACGMDDCESECETLDLDLHREARERLHEPIEAFLKPRRRAKRA